MQIRRVGGVVLLGIGMLMGAHAVAAKEPKPVPVSTPLPIYTQQLRDSGKEGRVTIDFTIGSRGEVTGLFAVEKSDEPLAEQAVAAIVRWRFKAPGADSRITGRNWRTSFNFAGGVVTWEGIWENPDKVENARILIPTAVDIWTVIARIRQLPETTCPPKPRRRRKQSSWIATARFAHLAMTKG